MTEEGAGQAEGGGLTGGVPPLDRQSLLDQWHRIRARLRVAVGETNFQNWLEVVSLVDIHHDTVRLSLPTRFECDWVSRHYMDLLRLLWVEENPTLQKVRLTAVDSSRERKNKGQNDADAAPPARMPEEGQAVMPPRSPSRRNGIKPQDDRGYGAKQDDRGYTAKQDDRGYGAKQDSHGYAAPGTAPTALSGAVFPDASGDALAGASVSAPLDPRFTFENFVTGKPNELAFAAARRVAESPNVPFNPLFLYGGVGLGKTHLMHAIAWHIRCRDPDRRVIYLSAEKFMHQFIRALRFRDTVAFKEQFRSVDVLMIDDVQFISGKDSTQEEFFHTFNALVDENRQVIVSADKSPSDLEGLEERLRSRLGWGLVADLHPTTYELRLSILQMKAEPLGVEIPAKVMEFLAHKITSNVRELEGALNRVVAYATLVGRPITLETTHEVLHDLLRASDRRVTIDEIQKCVAEHFQIRLADMSSKRRERQVARPRQVAMYLAKQLTARSLPEIGRKFGGRDHTTVIHAVRKVEELVSLDSSLAEDVELLRRMLEN